MNGKAWTANPLLAGMLLLALGVPCAFADDDKKTDVPCTPKPFDVSNSHKEHDMSPEAKLLPEVNDGRTSKRELKHG